MFADNTNVFMSHKDPDYLSNMLNLEMDKLSIWFQADKLSLNLKMTKVMVFRPSQKRVDCDPGILAWDVLLLGLKLR